MCVSVFIYAQPYCSCDISLILKMTLIIFMMMLMILMITLMMMFILIGASSQVVVGFKDSMSTNHDNYDIDDDNADRLT